MTISKSPLSSPLGRAQGLGSAKEGAHHWWAQRLTSIALVPLSLWFMFVLCTKLIYADRVAVADWFANPLVAITMLSFLVILIIHCKNGLQEVIEDYIHKKCYKLSALILSSAFHYGLAIVTVFAIAKLHFIGI